MRHTAVEQESIIVLGGLLLGGVGDWVLQAAPFAILAGELHVKGVD
jgi:hypothetical protein